MTVSSPTRMRIGRALNTTRDRRIDRLDRAQLRSELVSFQTTSELSELSAIAARNEHADTGELRKVLSHQIAC
jgi:hypothetical protein